MSTNTSEHICMYHPLTATKPATIISTSKIATTDTTPATTNATLYHTTPHHFPATNKFDFDFVIINKNHRHPEKLMALTVAEQKRQNINAIDRQSKIRINNRKWKSNSKKECGVFVLEVF